MAKAKNKTHKKVHKTQKFQTSRIVKQVEHAVSAARTKVAQKVKEVLKPATQRVEVHVVRKTLGKAPEEYHFVLHDGRKLKSLYDLVDELETMSEDAFKEYVSDFKNDFANWTRDVFKASDLAEELTSVKNRFETQKAIMKHMLRDAKELVAPLMMHKTQAVHKHDGNHSEHAHRVGKCVIK